MSGNHETPQNLNGKLKFGLILNSGFTIFEFIIGFASGSLALVSDAAHNLTDSLSLLVTFFANKISKREANLDKTYGYGRATVLGALINAIILLGLSVYIFYEAYSRFQSPEPVKGGLVVVVAFVGILINGGIALLFYKSKGDLNIRSSFLNMAMDAVASVGALIAGLIIVVTGKTYIDPIISVFIGLMLLYSGWSVVRDALHVLLDGVPEGMDVQELQKAIINTPGVLDMDDLHVWSLSTTSAAMSCHLVVKTETLQESLAIKESVKRMLEEKFHIDHATLEIEVDSGPHYKERTDEGIM